MHNRLPKIASHRILARYFCAILAILSFFSISAYSQGVRYDNVALRPTGGTAQNVTVTVCSAGATGIPCSPKATTFTDGTLNTPCSSSNQVVLTGTTTCVATGDAIGNYGFWLPPGQYVYTITGGSTAGQSVTITLPPLIGSNNTWTGTNIFPRASGFYYVDGTTYPTIQSAITAACSATPAGGVVWVPPGTYPQNSAFTWCTDLNVWGAGSGQADSVTCPVTITTTMTSGDLVPWSAINDGSLKNVCIKNTGAGSSGSAIRITAGQRNRIESVYITGPFALGIGLNSSSTAPASTIWNEIIDVHCSNLAAGGVGIEFNSADAVAKVINSNIVWNDHCTGGTGGKALWFTNTNQAQVINENIINCSECSATSGTAIQFDQGTTSDTVLIAPNAEGSSVGFSKATANTVTVVGGNISANGNNSLGANVSDTQPLFTIWQGVRIGGATPTFSVSPAGDLKANSLCIGGATCDPNNIAVLSGQVIEASGTTVVTLNNTGMSTALPVTSTVTTGTAPLVVASTTNVANLNASSLNGATFASPGSIGGTTPAAGKFTTLTETNLLISNTAPTIAGAGCGGSAASIATNNGTASFSINVGSTPTTACTVTLPSATNAWNCYATDITTQSTSVFFQKQTATGQTTATVTNFNTAGSATNLVASDILQVSCFAR